jgi:hypothetical protein
VVETSVVSYAITLKQLAELHSETITCCNCLPQIAISSFCMVGDRYLAFGGLRCLEMSENFMSIAEGQKDDVMSMLSSAFPTTNINQVILYGG